MKNIKKTVTLSLVTISFLSFGIHTEPVKAQNFLTKLLFPNKSSEARIDLLYGKAPDYDTLYGKEPPTPKFYNPNSVSPYGHYGNRLENLMGRDIGEVLELNKRLNKRLPGYGNAENKTFFRAVGMLPIGKLEKTIPLEDGNIAYKFYTWGGGSNGTSGTPDQMVTQYMPYGGGNSYIVSGTPGTPSSAPWNCTTYIVADLNGKLFYWSYKGSSDSIDDCSSDMRRLK
jgi:hypothetical protein